MMRAIGSRRLIGRSVLGRGRSLSAWAQVPQGPPDAILGITEAFKADSFKEKINLGVGAYRDDNGKPYVLPSVLEAEKRLVEKLLDKEYAGINGIPTFTSEATKLAYADAGSVVADGRVVAAQSISGTGALRLGGEFLNRWYEPSKKIYVPKPTWANHSAVFKDSGLEVGHYRYYDASTIGLDMEGMLADLKDAPDRSMILLHACAHNPTGVDPTNDEWKEIEKVISKKGHFVFFDMAYQGFASGDTNRDAFAVRHFVEQGHQIVLAQSFAKNMGLYGERTGAFSIITESKEEKNRVDSQLKIIIRPLYSNPPVHGARIAAEILGDAGLRSQWLSEVKGMAERIQQMRSLLKSNLEELGSQRNWDHITKQIGMFCYSGLTPEQVDILAKEHSVYMTRDGRISIAGVTSHNVARLASAINTVTST
ncbi:pyridoxal phosphate-dependent transferase [Dipodascopsis uninucleata]